MSYTSYLPVSTIISGSYQMNERKSCNFEIETTLLLNIRVNTLKLSFWDKKEQIKVKWKHWKYQFNSLSIKVYIGSWYGGFYFISFIFICYSSKDFYYQKMLRAYSYSIAMKIKMEIKTKLIELFYFIFVKYGSGWGDKFNYICCKLCNNAIKQLLHTEYSTVYICCFNNVNVILKEWERKREGARKRENA